MVCVQWGRTKSVSEPAARINQTTVVTNQNQTKPDILEKFSAANEVPPACLPYVPCQATVLAGGKVGVGARSQPHQMPAGEEEGAAG